MRKKRDVHFLFAALLTLFANVAPTSLVQTFIGTSGTPVGGPIDTFPGADMPFGMVQWSPDTPSANAGGGYEYSDKTITGFSLTHLSGPGCSASAISAFFQRPAMCPAIRPAQRSRSCISPKRAHRDGTPSRSGTPAIRTELTVTPRTGINPLHVSRERAGQRAHQRVVEPGRRERCERAR